MPSTGLPTLWSPGTFFAHVALWAGVPAAVVAVVVWLLGLYHAAKSWAHLAKSTAQGFQGGRVMTEHRRAMVRFAVYSILMVAFSYTLAVMTTGIGPVDNTDPTTPALQRLQHLGQVQQWSPATIWTMVVGVVYVGLLGVACIADLASLKGLVLFVGSVASWAARVAGVILAVVLILGWIAYAVGGSMTSSTIPILVTLLIITVLCLVVGLLLPQIRKACDDAFN